MQRRRWPVSPSSATGSFFDRPSSSSSLVVSTAGVLGSWVVRFKYLIGFDLGCLCQGTWSDDDRSITLNGKINVDCPIKGTQGVRSSLFGKLISTVHARGRGLELFDRPSTWITRVEPCWRVRHVAVPQIRLTSLTKRFH